MAFTNFDQFLDGKAELEVDKNGAPSGRDLKITVAAVLYKVVAADDSVTGEELSTMVRLLNKQFELTDEDSGYFTEVAHALLSGGTKIETLLEKVRDSYAEPQRVTLLAMVWKLMNADGFVSKPEVDYAIKVTEALGLSAEHVERAKQLVEDGEV